MHLRFSLSLSRLVLLQSHSIALSIYDPTFTSARVRTNDGRPTQKCIRMKRRKTTKQRFNLPAPSHREDAASGAVEGDAVDGREVSQDPLVHLHVLVDGRGQELAQAVRAVQTAPVTRLHWCSGWRKKYRETKHARTQQVRTVLTG